MSDSTLIDDQLRGDEPRLDEKGVKRAFRVLFISQMSLGFAQSLIFAVLPPIARQLGMDEVQTGMIFMVSAVLWIFMNPFWGRQSDKFGRKPIMVFGTLGFAASILSFGLVVDLGMAGAVAMGSVFPLLMAARTLNGLIGSGARSASSGYVADITPRADRSSGMATTAGAFGIGNMMGPAIAGGLIVISFSAPFWFVGGMAIFSAILILTLLPEKRLSKEEVISRRATRVRPWDRRVWPFMLTATLIGLAQTAYMQTVAFYFLDTLHVGPEEATRLVGIGLTALALSALIAQFGIVRRFKLGPQYLLRAGPVILICAYGLLAWSDSVELRWLAMALIGLGNGILGPGNGAAVSISVTPDEQGSALGFVGGMFAVGHVLSPFLIMPLYQWTPEAPYLMGVSLMVFFFAFVNIHPLVRRVRS
ncbi:norA [Symbiodinium microadriaticum]|nr:norA [Symbiodinium microadriaticum]